MRLAIVTVAMLVIALSACTPESKPIVRVKLRIVKTTRVPRATTSYFANPDLPVTEPEGVIVEDFVEGGLDFAVDMAWDGRDTLFITQKSGAIRVVSRGKLLPEPCATLPVNAEFLSGLLGIVLDPEYAQNHYLYVFYTNKKPYENRVTRFVVQGNRCTSPDNIVTGIPASRPHNGGQMVFVDDKLFVTTGDTTEARRAQVLDDPAGKILRYEADGSIPTGNPFSTADEPNPVWSYGHRNQFGLALRSGTKQLFQTENGHLCNDELNLIVRGGNYGWKSTCEGETTGENPRPALMTWAAPIVPTDLWWYDGKITDISDSLLMAEFAHGRVHRFELSEDGEKVLKHTVIYQGEGRIIHVSEGPGGWLYLLYNDHVERMIAS